MLSLEALINGGKQGLIHQPSRPDPRKSRPALAIGRAQAELAEAQDHRNWLGRLMWMSARLLSVAIWDAGSLTEMKAPASS